MGSPDLEGIQKTLRTIAETDLTKPREVRENAIILEDLLLSGEITPPEEAALVHYLTQNGLLKKMQLLYENFESRLEIDFAKGLLANNISDYGQYFLYGRFLGLIRTEIQLAQIEKQDKVLFIGSGPFPISAILLNELTGCHVDCYEKNKDYARLSSEVISHLGLADRIRIENRKGEYLINTNYSIVVIALLAKPKNEILKRLTERISSHARLICRTADPLRQAFYEAAEPECFKLFKTVSVHHAGGNQTISSILLKPVNW
jgi:hypothetical protein